MSPPNTPDRAPACPLCGRPSAADQRPFCSQGCRDRDLLNWLDEGYRLPEREDEGDADENPRGRLDSAPETPL